MHINVLHGLNSRCSKYQKHHCRQRWWLGSMWCFTSLMSFYSQAGRCRTAGARPVALHTYHAQSPALMSENPDFFSNFSFFSQFSQPGSGYICWCMYLTSDMTNLTKMFCDTEFPNLIILHLRSKAQNTAFSCFWDCCIFISLHDLVLCNRAVILRLQSGKCQGCN